MKRLLQKVANRLRRLLRRLRNTRLVDMGSLYQYWEQEHLKRLFREYNVDCVFDVGANYGQYAEMIRKRAKYRGLIISFEPIPRAAAALREKAKNDPRWIVLEQALSTENGQQTLNIMSGNQFSSLSTPRHDDVGLFEQSNQIVESVTVTTETLVSAFERLRAEHQFERPFLKMDTQGYDVQIVNSAKPVMSEFIGLQSELAVKKLYEHSVDFRDAIAAYEDCGFMLSVFAPNNAGFFPLLIETDCIMINGKLVEE